ncbi:MAG TPA: hypothetical protein DHT34_04220, partial [Cellvibrionales bacterium]|nr:hypothetical protein [Cellvibrionales bacterium]
EELAVITAGLIFMLRPFVLLLKAIRSVSVEFLYFYSSIHNLQCLGRNAMIIIYNHPVCTI